MQNLVEKAIEIARKYHEGQFRNDKITPYFNHLEAVANLIESGNIGSIHDFKFFGYDDYYGQVLPYLKAIAYGHDLLEDTNVPIELLNKEFPSEVVVAVQELTKIKDNSWSYVAYLQRIKANLFARVVKIADLTHNLSDLKPGNLRDKYELSKYFLEN